MPRTISSAILPGLVLGACGSAPPHETVPADLLAAVTAPPARSPSAADRGELILRSGGKDIGHEQFSIARDGRWDKVELTAVTTFPDRIAIELAMWVDPSSWELDRYDLHIARGGSSCVVHLRNLGDVVELEAEAPDGQRRLVDREGRDHAEHFVAIRPTITQSAICARANDRPQALDSFAPWYIVRTAPRVRSTIPAAAGKGYLDLVKVDERIDVYCDGPRLAIVHYADHAFVAARAEYDAAARALTADDPTDKLWASELGCPAATAAP